MGRDHAYTCERCGVEYGGLSDHDTTRCPECYSLETEVLISDLWRKIRAQGDELRRLRERSAEVERLRAERDEARETTCAEADEADRLRAEAERLREALREASRAAELDRDLDKVVRVCEAALADRSEDG